MEEVGAIDVGSFLLCPTYRTCLFGTANFQLQVKFLIFLEFYTFVGCIVLLFNPILMVNVEVLLMFSQPPHLTRSKNQL